MTNGQPDTLAPDALRGACEALLGEGVCESPGVVHVCSTVHTSDARRRVIAIGPHAPKSEHDALMLQLSRARADAILTTAANIRAEPGLSHALVGPQADALSALRRDHLGKASPPMCAILTRTGKLPLAHPVWDDGTPKLVFTEPENAEHVAEQLDGRAQLVPLAGLTARAAVAWLKDAGMPDVSVEVGPSSVGPLYEAPVLVDALWMSRCDAPDVPAEALGGALPEAAQLFAGFSCVHESARDEPSGRWVFQRWARVR